MIKKDTEHIINQLGSLLSSLKKEEYTKPLEIFNGSSIGQHFRHILEFYITLIEQKDGEICYDKRKRELVYEIDIASTLDKFKDIVSFVQNMDEHRSVSVYPETASSEGSGVFDSTIGRELMFVFDHTVHHLAIIKIGIMLNFPEIALPENLGVAPSTIKYRKAKCAQ